MGEFFQLLCPADKGGACGLVLDSGLESAEAEQDVFAGGSQLRLAPEQIAAERIEVFGNAGGEFGRIGRIEALLAGNQLAGGAGEGTAAGEGFEQHDAHGVPIGCFGRRQSGDLLRRHVRGSAGARIQVSGAFRAHFGDQSEIEDDDATFAGYEHVGRFDVAVQGARTVKLREPFRQLAGGCAKARRVRGTRHAREGTGCGAAVRGEHDFGHWQGRRDGPRLHAFPGGWGTDVSEEVHAGDKLHGEEPVLSIGDELVEGDQVGMTDFGEGAELAFEAKESVGAGAVQRL